MTLITGAGRYLNAATLANTQGTAPSVPTLLSQESSTASILDAGRNALAIPGIGVSAGARALTQDFLSRTADINQMFSLGLGSGATLQGLQQQILALRATLPLSSLGASVIEVDDDSSTVPASGTNGTNIDTDA